MSKHIIQQLIIEMSDSIDHDDWSSASNINKAIHKLLINERKGEVQDDE